VQIQTIRLSDCENAGLKVKVFLVGGGGAGWGGGGGSGHLAEAVVQVPPSGQLAVTIGLGGRRFLRDGNGKGLSESGGDTGKWRCVVLHI